MVIIVIKIYYHYFDRTTITTISAKKAFCSRKRK